MFWYVFGGSPPVISTGLPDAPKGGMNFLNAASSQIGLLDNVASWAIGLAIIVVATTGKLGGTVLGALMNTRGLMELIALNVGYDRGILTPQIFAMMVLMALATTAMTGPLPSLSLSWGRRPALASAGSMIRSS